MHCIQHGPGFVLYPDRLVKIAALIVMFTARIDLTKSCLQSPTGPEAAWRAGRRTHESYMLDVAHAPPALTRLPGFHLERVMPDPMHTVDLGVTPYICASAIWELVCRDVGTFPGFGSLPVHTSTKLLDHPAVREQTSWQLWAVLGGRAQTNLDQICPGQTFFNANSKSAPLGLLIVWGF